MIQLDPQGNKRTIPVKFMDGPHKGLVVWHSPQEYKRLTKGIVCLECGEDVHAHEPSCTQGKPFDQEC